MYYSFIKNINIHPNNFFLNHDYVKNQKNDYNILKLVTMYENKLQKIF